MSILKKIQLCVIYTFVFMCLLLLHLLIQASILESTFSLCHRLVLQADPANSLEAAAQVLPLTQFPHFLNFTLNIGPSA